jgi:hypothetical protein
MVAASAAASSSSSPPPALLAIDHIIIITLLRFHCCLNLSEPIYELPVQCVNSANINI